MRAGDIDIDFLGHAGFLIRFRGRTIALDPYHISEGLPVADLILISHGHSDHCSIRDAQKLSKKGTVVLCPVDCQSTLIKVKGIDLHIVEQEDFLDFGYVTIECFPAYTAHKRHAKQEGWLGYVIRIGKTIVYFAGDTDAIPEMQRLSGYGKKGNTFITLLPVAGDDIMNYVASATLVQRLNPALALPITHGNERDAHLFVELCKQQGFNSQLLDKI